MRLRWRLFSRRATAREVAEAVERAEEVERQLIEPLRAMRRFDRLTEAVQQEMRRKIVGGEQ